MPTAAFADGDIDPTFDPGTGTNSYVYTSAVQADGKIIIGGLFTTVNDIAINRIARLNADGSIDAGFNPGGTGANSYVFTSTLQADGKIIMGGLFGNVNGTPQVAFARLNTDGSVDTGFNPGGAGANNSVYTSAVQADGKIIIGGFFTRVNGTTINGIARLNSDGSLDGTFNPGTGVNGYIYTSAVQADGKIIIGGSFTSVNGTLINRIARLNTDGSVDVSFIPGAAANNYIRTLAVQADGKIVIGGSFTSVDGSARNSIARLNADGSLDAGFDPGTGANNVIYNMALQSDGKIVIVGAFTSVDGTANNRVARLNTDGSVDNSFDSGTGVNSIVYASALQADGKIIIGGYFTSVNSTAINRIARIQSGPDVDGDGDGILNSIDNCIAVSNAPQTDMDGDGEGDACDADIDGDGVLNASDTFPSNPALSGDVDGDTVDNNNDNCPAASNVTQTDTDGNGFGDACDAYMQSGVATGDNLGTAVAVADMNNDGYDDLIVGIPRKDVSSSKKDTGEIQIISGSNGAVLNTFTGTKAGGRFGSAIAVIADQNSDGVPDLIVGSPFYDTASAKDCGKVALHSGADGSSLQTIVKGSKAGDQLGASVAVADVDNDGGLNLIVGAPRKDLPELKDAGQVTVYRSFNNNLVLYQRYGTQAGERFGSSIAINQAEDQLLVGSPLYDVDNGTVLSNAGRVSIFDATDISGGTAALYTLDGVTAENNFGSAVASFDKDLDGDTFNEWAVGSAQADAFAVDAGKVEIFSGFNATAFVVVDGATVGDNFGAALATGNVNNDGTPDLAVGSPRFDVPLADAGRVEVLSGDLF